MKDTSSSHDIDENKIALVVFEPLATVWWQHFLKAPFRHVFVLIDCGDIWVEVFATGNRMHVGTRGGTAEELFRGLDERGFIVVMVEIRGLPPRLRIRPWTCTETVKRLIGVEGWFVWTPAQLYKYLHRR